MEFILEYSKFNNWKEGDIVWIHYWYKFLKTPVKLLKKKKGGWIVTHDIEQSKLKNAPDEQIKNTDIFAEYKPKQI